ncbi:cytochrome c oxidase assembly protein COX11, mitochondrial [Eurytemora carolleeae]|uniref:cytochrome c oxidase assembly protein COX11, mitochondrial n=1 Tax=Eurytemora carolleeae TaxID=1294199 RepID=UPI000C76D4EE|nr:cytochrome c oxidase assembly protein COX11, mitochondrial [Eurytemora carolleeae]|eukprot:XP_023326635.1 cytochrome c oxidase assembly protein COX11, mitochondrial-like [Eurytemora affinis]
MIMLKSCLSGGILGNLSYSRYSFLLREQPGLFRTFFGPSKRPKRPQTTAEKNKTTLLYLSSAVIATVGASYAAVPLYRVFCQSTGYGGTVVEGHDAEKVVCMQKQENRLLTIKFNADTAAQMRWNFRPQQSVVHVHPGETALAFYTAKNPTEKPIDGVSTYNVVPFEAGQYFNKIQCFCFEEQRLNPGEEVDMPVFFYIDPDYVNDPFLQNSNEITLSYTFFESKPGMKLPTFNPGVRK